MEHNMMHVYINRILLVSVLQNFSCDSHVNVLSSTVAAKADKALKRMLSNNVAIKMYMYIYIYRAT